MPRYRVEISARALGWVEGIEAANEDAAIEIARKSWSSSDFDDIDGPVEIEGVEEDDD